jgi:hypothetical protein
LKRDPWRSKVSPSDKPHGVWQIPKGTMWMPKSRCKFLEWES